ncbi:hypothetical protein E4T42_01330 [Aureobasidium subglaciale]|uniref:Uncharacterized protein n=1 Tax=Aureobasidium subglaciale (strain EXF-2481) TaxID=1043005 RepID=A0A074YVH6_AURSE|nr:uncharacterized protein AUEXF2481DRAFT_34333 [Aureobasidium subglaciale EXF-2481]KAI5212222.1 hypothetical protein E4T38_00825 [Aureobasidium subglaciale]KAI5231323.1 hypothetical protein E4T40_00826 [Aureobasidium subglaciale]KAI5234086.1 hypothetical protein E4T41_00824 [Aureobasidium subglaciale]KAI5257185.1 hypothetical protein E4T42_01330 [Aureobasidium subglaciale]KAI5267559.1 hypothetical protein E4T46_00824 [Aureobasidium subglaciale]
MSSNSSTFTNSSYTFSSSSSSNDGQTTGATRSTVSHTNHDGTSVRTTQQNLGGPTIEETRHYDSQGREQLGMPQQSTNQRRLQENEVEDVTEESDADKKYREAMEDEYAKREGGA